MRLFLRNIIIYNLPILLIVFFVNLFIDPASLFRGIELQIAKYISSGFNITGVLNIDERILQKKIIENMKTTPKTVILGSSRIMMVGQKFYGAKSHNNGVSGASLEDIIAIYQIYMLNGKKADKFVIGIDPWLFNKNNEQIRWLSIKSDYDLYYSEYSNSIISNLPFHKYSQLVSPSYFQASIATLLKNEKKNLPVATNERFNNSLTRLTDGTITYGNELRNTSKGKVEDSAKNYINGDVYSIEKFNKISEKIQTEFENFIIILLQNGVEIEFLIMPYHPIVWSYIGKNDKYKTVKEVESYIYEFSERHKIKVVGSYNPEQFKLSNDDFYDGMHLSPDGIEKVIKQ
jgi:hypothetical protein